MLSYYRDINFAFSNWYVFKVQPGDRVPIVFPTVDLVPLGAAFAFGAKSMLASIRLASAKMAAVDSRCVLQAVVISAWRSA